MVALTPGRMEGDGGWADTSSAVAAAVLWYPATQLHGWFMEFDEFTMAFNAKHSDRFKELSPLDQVHSGAPPILTMIGDADRKISTAYGVLWPVLSLPKRVTFIVNPLRTIEAVFQHEVSARGHEGPEERPRPAQERHDDHLARGGPVQRLDRHHR